MVSSRKEPFSSPKQAFAIAAAVLAGPCASWAAAPATAQLAPEEVVVTATKSGHSLRKSAVAATVVDATVLQAAHLQSVQDIQILVPALVYNDAASHGEAYVRGVGSNFSLAGAESSVATYVNGAYLQRQTGANIDLIDVNNVQVLKGPQSSLYGRDATGGAIVVETNMPTPTVSGFISAEGGSYGHYGVTGVLNDPIADTLGLRVVGDLQHLGNYINNVGPGHGGDLGGYDNRYGRATLQWTPTSAITAALIGEYSYDRNNEYPQHLRVGAPLCLACAIYGVTVPTGFYDVSGNDPGPGGLISPHDGYQILDKYWSLTLQLKYRGPLLDITSVSSFRDSDLYGNSEEDRTTANLEYAEVNETGPTFTQDVYLRTHIDSPVNLLLGAFFERERDTQQTTLIGDAFGGLPDVGQSYLASIDSVSGYGEINYEILKGLVLTGDIRYNHDTKSGAATNDAGGEAISGYSSYYQSLRQGDFTPRGVISYTRGPQYFYGSFSIGKKSEFFTAPSFAPLPPLKEETLKEGEIGAKNEFLGGLIHTDVSAFYGEWSNIVVQYDDPASGGIRAQNAAQAQTYGFEAHGDWHATPQFNLGLGAAYLHNTFTNYPNAAVYAPSPTGPGFVNSTEDLTGSTLPRSPRFTGTINADYTFPLPRGWSLVMAGVGRYTSKFNFISGGGGPLDYDVQNAFFKMDGSFTLTDPSGKYSAQLYSTNLTGSKYFTYAATDTYGPFFTAAAPREVGIRLRRSF